MLIMLNVVDAKCEQKYVISRMGPSPHGTGGHKTLGKRNVVSRKGDAPSMTNLADLCRECEVRQSVKELEEAGDRMAKRLCLIINSERTPDNASIDAVKNWWKAKEESK